MCVNAARKQVLIFFYFVYASSIIFVLINCDNYTSICCPRCHDDKAEGDGLTEARLRSVAGSCSGSGSGYAAVAFAVAVVAG